MIAEQTADTAGVLVLARFCAAGFVQGAAQHQGDDGSDRTDHEGNSPAPGAQLVFGQQLLQDHHHQYCQQLAANQGHVLERCKEAPLATQRHFAHVGRRGAVFTPHRQALNQARQQQQCRRPCANTGVSGQAGDGQGPEAHHQYRDHQRVLATVAVGQTAEDPAADRPHQKACGKHAGGIEQLHGRVI